MVVVVEVVVVGPTVVLPEAAQIGTFGVVAYVEQQDTP